MLWHCRSVRTDDGEEVHVLVSPVRSQGGDDSPSSPSRLPDSVLKAMCNMGKAFLSRSAPTPPLTVGIIGRAFRVGEGVGILATGVHAPCSAQNDCPALCNALHVAHTRLAVHGNLRFQQVDCAQCFLRLRILRLLYGCLSDWSCL